MSTNDYGCNPVKSESGKVMFQMVPSGDIVEKEEKERRLTPHRKHVRNDCLGLSWEQIEQMQGGKIRL